jgi:K+/H+ antiporter YhaU regulatory subunit KhtT
MIIAIRRRDGALEMMPPPSTPIVANDVLVLLGTRDQFSELESLTSTPGGAQSG